MGSFFVKLMPLWIVMTLVGGDIIGFVKELFGLASQ